MLVGCVETTAGCAVQPALHSEDDRMRKLGSDMGWISAYPYRMRTRQYEGYVGIVRSLRFLL